MTGCFGDASSLQRPTRVSPAGGRSAAGAGAAAAAGAPTRTAVALLATALVALAAVGVAAAQEMRFVVEPEHSQITFHATSRFVDVDGRFHRFTGEVVVDPREPTRSRVRLRVDAGSIDTANARRDAHLRSEDFFHVERFPHLLFESTRVEGSLPRLLLTGRLTAHGVTREIQLPVEVEITGASLTARGQFDLKRTDYGISYQSFLNPVGDVVRVAFLIRARAGGGS